MWSNLNKENACKNNTMVTEIMDFYFIWLLFSLLL